MACGMICSHGVSKRFDDTVAVDDAQLCAERGRTRRAPRPERLRQDDAPAAHRRASSGPTRGRSSWRSPGRGQRRVGAARAAPRRDGLPGLRALPAPDRRRERRLRRLRAAAAPPALPSALLVGLDGLGGASRTSSRAASSSASRSPARSRRRPPSSCSTSRGRTSTRCCAATMRDELAAILRGIGVTVVLVTHDREEAFSLADRIALMRDGADRPGGVAGGAVPRPGRPLDGRVRRRRELPAGPRGRNARRDAARPLPVANNGHSRSDVEVLIRPELLELRIDPNGPGEVVGREFRGHDVFYRVRSTARRRLAAAVERGRAAGRAGVVKPHAERVPVFA